VDVGELMLAVSVGLASGVLSGLFGVGGGIIMTPGLQMLLGAPPIVALATPLPIIFPTALSGALRYRRAGALLIGPAAWMAASGLLGAAAGAALTAIVPTHLLLVITAGLLAWQSLGILLGGRRPAQAARLPATPLTFAGIGLTAGLVSGLLGIGGGIVMVPLLAGLVGMPLKQVLGTSLATIAGLVIPGTIVHASLGHIDWPLFAAVTLGAVPGARVGAAIALGTNERLLRRLVGGFMLFVAAAYGAVELVALFGR
jgi:uncharacterized membrane protein YfcA